MIKKITDISSQYRQDIFRKLNFPFLRGKKMLDVGCGDGEDSRIFIELYKLNTFATDMYRDENIKTIKGLKFKKGSIYKLPYKANTFDYVFLHDVLHHVDEKCQQLENHTKSLEDIKRVVKRNGVVIIIEGNRYNPLFYPHMVKIRHHEHFKQEYFKLLVKKVFRNPTFLFFEAHLYPKKLYKIFKIYEAFMERYAPKGLLAYNVSIIKISQNAK